MGIHWWKIVLRAVYDHPIDLDRAPESMIICIPVTPTRQLTQLNGHPCLGCIIDLGRMLQNLANVRQGPKSQGTTVSFFFFFFFFCMPAWQPTSQPVSLFFSQPDRQPASHDRTQPASTVQYSTIQYNTIQYRDSTVQYSTAVSTLHYRYVQYNTVHYTVLCSKGLHHRNNTVPYRWDADGVATGIHEKAWIGRKGCSHHHRIRHAKGHPSNDLWPSKRNGCRRTCLPSHIPQSKYQFYTILVGARFFLTCAKWVQGANAYSKPTNQKNRIPWFIS